MIGFVGGFILFLIGFVGIVYNKHDLIKLIVSVEVMLMSLMYLFIMASVVLDDVLGVGFSMIILAVAGCESVVGLSILISYFQICDSVNMESLVLIQG